ncbi:T-complex [Salix suchowensis]|nr:T-complex [Salix suchowensis]
MEELTEAEKVAGGGLALSFTVNDDEAMLNSPKVLPPRLKRRLLGESKTLPSAEEIEAKLREANLRRQRYYELLSSKARSSTSRSGLSDFLQAGEDLGHKLEARLNAAQQKRLSILTEAQMRLARLDEHRQEAKSGLETRFEKERDELGMKVESRVQQAEANRMLLLKAYGQRRAAKRERAAQSLMRKMTQEINYKESVRAAIYQKRVAAERKRLGLLEAERTKAHSRTLQVQRVAMSIYSQRETERKRIKEQLEYKLLKAKKQRAEYLRQRRKLNSQAHVNSKTMHEQGEDLSIKLARCWRRFVKLRKTTLSLAKAYMSLQINQESVKSMPFVQLALCIESATTIQIVKAFVNRLESRMMLSRAVTGNLSSLSKIDHLLKHAALPSHKGPSSNAARRGAKMIKSSKLSRYPVRVLLCAFMIMGHPSEVFNRVGECEIALADSAANFIQEFELLVKIIIDGPAQTSQEITSANPSQKTFRSQLEVFDKAWCIYLNHFVAWKSKDVKLLEKDLVRAACQLELSLLQTCKLTSRNDGGVTRDMKGIKKVVLEEQKLLRETVQHLRGNAGLEHMEHALADVRSRFVEAGKSGTSMASSTSDILSSFSRNSHEGSSISGFGETRDPAECIGESSDQLLSLLQADDSSPVQELDPSLSKRAMNSIAHSDSVLASENELLVNEILHEHHRGLADSLNVTDEDQNSLKVKVREAMENAFWDGITESMKQDEPDFSWVLKLMKEVRDELCEMSPQSWREEIVETIDVDILSQVLKSGTLDMDYLGRILEFALVTLQKLSAPANDGEIMASHDNLLKELRDISQAADISNASFSLLMIKALRFILKEIQILKTEISRARIRLVEPLIKGPAGLEYLKKAFADRYGSPTDATSLLPLTRKWMASVNTGAEQEWEEYIDSVSATINDTQVPIPTALRTGGSVLTTSKIGPPTSTTGREEPGCTGEKADLLIRLGLMKLVIRVGGLTLEALPETLKLNLSRLRRVQSQLQKIITITTSGLVLRQTLLTEHLVTSSMDMENLVSECAKKLSELLDSVEDVGILEIVDTISELLKSSGHDSNDEKLQARKEVMSSMLVKSLQAGDAIFELVSRSIYLAMKGAVLGGSGSKGRQLVETALRRVGATLLSNRVMEAAEVLVVVAMVSLSVHGEWYEELIKTL